MHLRIPKERIGVLIGQDGKIRERIEKATNTTLDIDSETGEVVVENTKDSEDPSGAWVASSIVRAVGRGFNPWKAMRLLDEDMYLEMIDLSTFVGTAKNALQRVRGRVIGKDGKARQIIEQVTGTYISVYGKTVAIIGYLEELRVARDAITMLIEGTAHGPVYTYLQTQKRYLKRGEHEDWKPL